ncbi:MAG: hypothetical protein Ct9H300mP1_06100 [Planctomycetaceae bacterium]|nr:MAG: hypothetical protein Ct9H300mP1_06100 [Planctomycetaceae bacterium]
MHSGIPSVTGRPTLGSWLLYGLGSETDNLPAYMVMTDPGGHPVDGVHNWSNGWMPTLFQGTVLRPKNPRILNLDAPATVRGKVQEHNLSFLAQLNKRHARKHPGEKTWRRESPPTNWPPGCRPLPRRPWTFPRRPRRPRTCTGWTIRPPGNRGPAA